MDWLSMFVTGLVLLLTVIVIYVMYMSRNFRDFKKMGVPYESPWPGMGNVPEMMKEGFLNNVKRLYKKYENEKVYGTFMPGRSYLTVRDLDVIRDVCIKHFNSFINRGPTTKEEPLASTLLALEDERWKRVRNILSPTFSSGKLKRMSPHIERAVRNLLAELREGNEKDEMLELKEVMSCFTMDAIASTGFGVEINTLKDKSNMMKLFLNDFHRNSPFVTHAKKLMSVGQQMAGITIMFPFMEKILFKLGFFAPEAFKYFTSFVDEVMDTRRGQVTSRKRHDFVQILVDSEQQMTSESTDDSETSGEDSEKKYLTKNEIQAQGLIFLLAGYDTVSTSLSMCLFVLAHHPECCRKIQEELDRVLGSAFPTYEQVQELVYLDMCLTESMRLYPSGFVVDRMCSEDCVVQGIKIPKGMGILIPVICIHHDPNLWEEPMKFDPERFNATNKTTHHPFAYLPFGQGPRNCVGMRLALLEMKMALAAILQEMTPVPCDKSVYPMKLQPMAMIAEDGLWVKMRPRDKASS